MTHTNTNNKHASFIPPLLSLLRWLVPLAAAVLFLSACQTWSEHPLTRAADMFVNETVGPEYLGYVETNESLDEFQKRLRRDNVEAFRVAVDAAKGGGE